jgi:hypothetical protein
MAVLRDSTYPFARLDTKAAYRGAVLGRDEKRSLGLNPRLKYTREFIEYFQPSALGRIEPKGTLQQMHLDALHRASRTSELARLKSLGFVKVTIRPVNGCSPIRRLGKTYNLDEAPALPLKGCNRLCMCYYEAVMICKSGIKIVPKCER